MPGPRYQVRRIGEQRQCRCGDEQCHERRVGSFEGVRRRCGKWEREHEGMNEQGGGGGRPSG
jgi:hypothetical protein